MDENSITPALLFTLNSISDVENPKSIVDVSVYSVDVSAPEFQIHITVPDLLLFPPP